MSNPLLSRLEKRWDDPSPVAPIPGYGGPGTFQGIPIDPAHPWYYGDPEAERTQVTYAGLIAKAAFLLAVFIGGTAIGWMFVPCRLWTVVPLISAAFSCLYRAYRTDGWPLPVWVGGWSAAWAVLLGVAAGPVLALDEAQWSGILFQALLASVAVFSVTLLMYASGVVRVSARATKTALIACEAYGVFVTINILVRATGLIPDQFGLRGLKVAGVPVGLAIGLVGVLLAAYAFVSAFDVASHMVRTGAPRGGDWVIASVLILALISLYLEFVTIIALARRD
ncbi:MAG: Bax inhibitor-1/YccA family protein [Bifidobacteriaceae bacterium]|jgi:uncharacterized YccA/Bax inhibitor family protein|nr:Bax inhibitor-1/YccA family protein [Bifidobacteriaceae bacterium]